VVAADGTKIEYEVLGSGPPLVLLHGGFAGRSTYSRQRSLAARYRLILLSSRGHDGTEGTLSTEFGFDKTEVEDTCAVLDAAFSRARRFPERVDKLVLIEPWSGSLLPQNFIHRFSLRQLVN